MLKQRDSGHVPMRDPTTGQLNWVDERTEAIVTYALCGFANFASMGIMLGALGQSLIKTSISLRSYKNTAYLFKFM